MLETKAPEGASSDLAVEISPAALAAVIRRLRRAGRIHLLLDYDGTLVPIAQTPELAVPDADLFALLGRLTASPTLDVALVSGRARAVLESWFGAYPIAIWAEHGFWRRTEAGAAWQQALPESGDWLVGVGEVLERFVATTPGARLEPKSASVAWHYRGAEPDVGARQARALTAALEQMSMRLPLDVLAGKKVVEVRRAGISKALVAEWLTRRGVPAGQVVAFGDDLTDEELFAALPPASVTVAVGPDIGRARYRVGDPDDVRQLLSALCE